MSTEIPLPAAHHGTMRRSRAKEPGRDALWIRLREGAHEVDEGPAVVLGADLLAEGRHDLLFGVAEAGGDLPEDLAVGQARLDLRLGEVLGRRRLPGGGPGRRPVAPAPVPLAHRAVLEVEAPSLLQIVRRRREGVRAGPLRGRG